MKREFCIEAVPPEEEIRKGHVAPYPWNPTAKLTVMKGPTKTLFRGRMRRDGNFYVVPRKARQALSNLPAGTYDFLIDFTKGKGSKRRIYSVHQELTIPMVVR